ncbi:unnamed protein product, partial [Mesorhabditis belari]|uniref:Uncharacterized protein n=1 Tax=Mesorhabditis belari TaxID=2138241 RepID=A0AAF3EMY2_9BILA
MGSFIKIRSVRQIVAQIGRWEECRGAVSPFTAAASPEACLALDRRVDEWDVRHVTLPTTRIDDLPAAAHPPACLANDELILFDASQLLGILGNFLGVRTATDPIDADLAVD